MSITPTESEASRILLESLGKRAVSCKRFPTGLANYVYELITEEGDAIVVRLCKVEEKANFEGALYWYPLLQEKGIPLPALLFSELDESVFGFPVMIIERVVGSDLGQIYGSLSESQKQSIATKLASIQGLVASLPEGKGFGYAKMPDDPDLLPTWNDFIASLIERSRSRIVDNGIFDEGAVALVQDLIAKHEPYLSSVKPTCFLDDTTTKNVLVHEGKLQGIVDIDAVAFGDPLFVIALTYMALLSAGFDTNYAQYWLEKVGVTSEQEKVFGLYVSLYCLDFMSEMGMAFNKDEPEPVDQKRVDFLLSLLQKLTT